MKPVNETPLDFADFSLRTAKVLRLLKIESWEKLAALPKDQLLSAPGFGRGCLKEVERKVQEHKAQPSLWAKEADEPHAAL
jgi:DNA-directed RNA polymerase alpha subunit